MERISENIISLERATPADIEKYIAIERKVVSKTYSALLTEKEIMEEMAKGPVYMIKKDNVIVGTASYYMKADGSAYISGLVVDPAYQGQGISRQAMVKVLAELKDIPVVTLVTHPDNTRAVSLYKSLGFEVTGRIENFFGDGEPRIELTLNHV